jgi:hypothetical protein
MCGARFWVVGRNFSTAVLIGKYRCNSVLTLTGAERRARILMQSHLLILRSEFKFKKRLRFLRAPTNFLFAASIDNG